MGAKTGIEWTDSTWSPIRVRVRADAGAIARAKGYTSLIQIAEKMAGRVGQHCEHVSPGCAHCYAGTNNHRCLPGNGTGLPYDRRSRDLVAAFVDEKVLLAPLKWGAVQAHSEACELAWETLGGLRERRPKCGCSSRPRRIFVQNQSDLFGEWVSDELLDQVFAAMALCPQHIFQVLTKRPARMLAYFTGDRATLYERWLRCSGTIDPQCRTAGSQLLERLSERTRPLENIWLGVSVENQAAADVRIPLLLQTPTAVRFLSCEPLLGPVEFRPSWVNPTRQNDNPLGWVIAGGESGPGARPMHPDWARSLRDQCQTAGVPFFFKQHGEWEPIQSPLVNPRACSEGLRENDVVRGRRQCLKTDGTHFDRVLLEEVPEGAQWVERVGKHAAGALLDGREWREFPEVRA
ncbi:MAG: phage Gp37/Gp68 family protein [Acidobacteriota bacterium]